MSPRPDDASASARTPPAKGTSTIPGRAVVLLWLVIFGLGCAARLWHLDAQSLSMDEVTELELAARSAGDLIGADDGFPPLFSLLLHGWIRLFGESTARGLPAVLGILALPLMGRLGRELGGARVGLLALLLLALSPIHVWYSQEIRAYGLYFLLVILTMWRYAVARRTGSGRDWLVYAVAAGVGLYGHYYFGLLILALASLDILEPGPVGVRLSRLARRQGPIALVILPLVPLLIGDVVAQQAWPVQERSLDLHALAYTFLTFVAGFSLGPSLRELHTLPAHAAVRAILPWATALGLAAAYLLVAGLRDPDRRRLWLSLAIVTAVPLLACGVLGAVLDLAYRSRYVAWGAVPVLLLLALGASVDRRRWAAGVALGVLLAGSIAAIVNRQVVGRYWNEDARGAAGRIERLVGPESAIFVVSGYMAGPLARYLDRRWPLRPFSRAETVESPDPALADIKRMVAPGQSFWLVYSRPFDGDPAGRLRQALESLAGLRLRDSVPGIELYEGTGW